ncbi:hypothetical protein LXL04_025519 [Taraxacum kok-saghyz]
MPEPYLFPAPTSSELPFFPLKSLLNQVLNAKPLAPPRLKILPSSSSLPVGLTAAVATTEISRFSISVGLLLYSPMLLVPFYSYLCFSPLIDFLRRSKRGGMLDNN